MVCSDLVVGIVQYHTMVPYHTQLPSLPLAFCLTRGELATGIAPGHTVHRGGRRTLGTYMLRGIARRDTGYGTDNVATLDTHQGITCQVPKFNGGEG